MRTTTRVVGLLAATTLTLTTLTACSNDTDSQGSDTSSSADAQVSQLHNDADVWFATAMIPHHAQAIAMARMAENRAESQEVKDLAADIEAAQGPEIDLLSTMLETWGEDVPDPGAGAGGMGGMGGMGHGAAGDNMDDLDHGDGMDGSDDGPGMPGMMSPGDMSDLKDASGTGFDEMFLEMMVEHHEGAIEMALVEQADGENPQAIDLAKDIEAAQTDEIATMKELLGS
jgi:uncharacterized protein (DUF305 family)